MKLSIITINFNNIDGLRKTIESVISQTFTDYEYVVIDGGSTDGSDDLIKTYEDKITYWVSEPDKGIYNAMNKGILQAKGEYCLFLNSGDWLYSNDILSSVFSIDYKEDILYGDLFVVATSKTFRIYTPNRLSLHFFYIDSLCHPSAFIKRQLFNIELYDEQLKVVADWKFFMDRFIDGYSFKKLPYVVSYFDRILAPSYDKDIGWAERCSIIEKTFPKYIIPDYEAMSIYKQVVSEESFETVQSSFTLRRVIKKCINIIVPLYKLVKKLTN